MTSYTQLAQRGTIPYLGTGESRLRPCGDCLDFGPLIGRELCRIAGYRPAQAHHLAVARRGSKFLQRIEPTTRSRVERLLRKD